MNLQIFAWISSIAFAICGLPQAIQCYKQKHANGISWSFLLLWLVGEICGIIYFIPKKELPILLNYGVGTIFLLTIIFYKLKSSHV